MNHGHGVEGVLIEGQVGGRANLIVDVLRQADQVGESFRSIDEFWCQVDSGHHSASRAVEEAGRPANTASHVENVVVRAQVERVGNELAAGPAANVKLVGASQRVWFQSVWVESGCG